MGVSTGFSVARLNYAAICIELLASNPAGADLPEPHRLAGQSAARGAACGGAVGEAAKREAAEAGGGSEWMAEGDKIMTKNRIDQYKPMRLLRERLEIIQATESAGK